MSRVGPERYDDGQSGGAVPDAATFELDADGDPAAIRVARQFVEREVVARGADGLADEVTLAAAELLANAVQHGTPPVSISISGDRQRLRLEVRDANPRPPVRLAPNPSNMTGRGLALVDAVAARWGIDRTTAGGKIVWAEFEPADRDTGEPGVDLDALLAAWGDDEVELSGPRRTVVLGDVPTDLLIEAKAHIDNLVREFSLAETAGQSVPDDLARLIRTVVHGFAEARDAIKRQALAAARRAEPRTRLNLHLPASAAEAGEAYLAALDEADAYARAARLLTLETPPAHRLFRHWYVREVIRQLRADKGLPEPSLPFETRMLEEIQRLATLQRITDRAARLQRVTAALASARTPEEVADVVVSEGVAALGAVGGSLLVPAEDGEHLAVPGAVGYGEELVDALREERLDAPLPAATALRTGEPIWLESQYERDRQFPALSGFEAVTVSMCAVPLLVGDRTIGALRFSFGTRRLFDEDERSFVLALAAQTAHNLMRTRRYAAERQASLNLQRALLPEGTADIPGWDIAAYYRPAGNQEAGGDFYDVLPLDDGRVVAVVGDVMGRGIEAAAAMAQIRTMIRAYAIVDPEPLSVFGKVDRFFEVSRLSQLVTAMYFLIDPAHGTVEMGNAGHLPPILVEKTGSRTVSTPIGTPFGVDGLSRETSRITLSPGNTVVVVTDGLVERRGEDIDRGIERILAATANGAGLSAAALVQRLLQSGIRSSLQDDDVTVLALRRC
jgi:serine phosphatase RsbU (regulator of sigma subunit)/anti-sigma regulatory factor (Ser/Thr protein kinase)